MRNKIAKLTGIAAMLLAAGSVKAAYVETFDSGNANWYYGYDTNFNNPQDPANWVATGGNPSGAITGLATSGTSGKGLYAVWTYDTAPYGDLTGLVLTVDTKVTGSASGTAQLYVGYDGSYFVDSTWSISSDTDWMTHSSALDAANFTAWTGVNNGAHDLADVLQHVDDIGIFFGGSLATGTGELMLDNFGTVVAPVPLPAAVWLLGSGLLGLLGAVRRKAA